MKKSKLPNTDSIQTLARFWDTHDLANFEGELEEVEEPVFTRTTPIQVHLSVRQARAIDRLARSKGVSREVLIREWVSQKLARRRSVA